MYLEKDSIYEHCLTKKQKKMFDKLDNKKLFECIEDRQGGCWAVGSVETIQGWVYTALEWIDSDGCIDEDQLFINSLLEGGIQAIEQIDDFWEITLQEVK